MLDNNLQPKKKLLYEVSIIRPTIIFLLVFLHSFTKIEGGGGEYRIYELNPIYEWLCYFISGFRIETIALIAGYVFSYQCNDLKRSYSFIPFLKKKFKRLIIPMLFFGIIYYFCFLYQKDSFALDSFIITLFSGCGHLWFLPMLFWCFVSIWLIDYYKISSWFLLIFLAIFSLMPTPSLPLGFGRFPHFLFFVYAGYFLWIKHDSLFKIGLRRWVIIGFCIVYIGLVIISHTIMPVMTAEMTLLQKGIIFIITSFVRLIMSCCGILALYLFVCSFTNSENFKPKDWIVKASNNCYGLYVFHQFILVWLYFYTPIYNSINEYLLPWIGFAITFVVSMLLTYYTLKTRIGRFLIG